ncbi:MAG: hypothetical protein ABMB14_35300, partial [Myxococcota bacterium]
MIRSLWLGRAWTTVPLLGFAVAGWSVAPSPVTAAVGIAVVAVELAAIVATRRLTRALIRGDAGEILLKAGSRVPVEVLRAAFRADTAELAATGVAVAALAGFATADRSNPVLFATVGGLGTLALELAIWFQRRWSNAMFEAHDAMMANDLDRAERVLGPALRSRAAPIRDAARSIEAQIALRRGRVAAARRRMEAAWNGALDDRAAQLALLQLGDGSTALAERWLASSHADRRYDRYLVAQVAGTLAVHQRAYDRALTAVRAAPDLPRWFVRQLQLVEAAALQGLGRTAEASAQLGALGGLDPDRWLATADPVLWGLLDDAAANRPTDPTAAPR